MRRAFGPECVERTLDSEHKLVANFRSGLQVERSLGQDVRSFFVVLTVVGSRV